MYPTEFEAYEPSVTQMSPPQVWYSAAFEYETGRKLYVPS